MKKLGKRKLERVISILEGAKKRISKGWVQGKYAVDVNGFAVKPTHKAAVRFCAIGAMEAETKSDLLVLAASSLFGEANDGKHPVSVNDHAASSKSDVLKAFTKSINFGKKKLKQTKIRTKV